MGLGMSVALSVATASALTVNGNLSDWGITVADGDNSNFSNPNLGIGLVNSLTEDQSDFAGNSGYVGPNYDAEYMSIAVQGTTMYLAIISGQRPHALFPGRYLSDDPGRRCRHRGRRRCRRGQHDHRRRGRIDLQSIQQLLHT